MLFLNDLISDFDFNFQITNLRFNMKDVSMNDSLTKNYFSCIYSDLRIPSNPEQ